MKLSYDYEALIHEIKADIRESILLPDDVIINAVKPLALAMGI